MDCINHLKTAASGFQATGETLQKIPIPATIVAGTALQLASPAGTIDFNANFKITGNGQVQFTGGETRGYPSYAAYSYQNVNGNIVTTKQFVVPENKIEDLTKPMRPIPR